MTNQTCDVNNNLINAFPEIFSVQECRELCKNTPECEVISYHGQDSPTFTNVCMIFTRCALDHSYCKDCFTEAKLCFDVCNIESEGSFNQDTVDVINDVPDEPSCVTQCRMNMDCKFYTYYTTYSEHPRMCLLLSDIEDPIKPCYNCRTGFPDCKNITTDFCHFSVGDSNDKLTSYKATKTFTKIELRVPSEALFSICDLKIVAIGSGGYPVDNGGGSGYIETASVSPIANRPLFLYVGSESRVDNAAGKTIVRALPGGSGNLNGDGYSGGGGYDRSGHNGGCGGSNGGNGTDGSDRGGGKGSGLDISTITLEHFKLTPAAGGKGCPYYGGGGGGVLVDEQGPPTPTSNPTPWPNPTPTPTPPPPSYGEGGSQCSYYSSQGIILIEIKKKE